MIAFDKRDALDVARVNIAENPDAGAPVGFGDRFWQAFQSFRKESLSVSREFNMQDAITEQNRIADSLGETIPSPIINDERELVPGMSYTAQVNKRWNDNIVKLKEKYPSAGFKTIEEIQDGIKKDAARLREVDRVGSKNATGSGDVGAAFGVMAGAVSDPVVLLSLPFGYGSGGQSLTWGQRVLRAAGIEGAIATTVETAIQPLVFQYKKEIESPYTVSDAALNVLAAGTGATVFGGLLQGGGELLKSYRKNKPNRPQTQDEKIAEEILTEHQEIVESSPYDKNIESDGVHADNIRDNAQTVVDGEPIKDVKQATVKQTAKTDELMLFDPDELEVDAKRFQFKSGGDSQGVTNTLKGVDEFDPRLAGVALVYEDEAGKRFIVDGHQRLGLAKRAKAGGQKDVQLTAFMLRASDGISDGEARAVAAFKNMAEGTGTAIDAAKILREVGERGLPALPPASALVRNARGLAQLSDDAFGAVVNGIIPENYGAIIGRLVDDEQLQLAIVDVVKKTAPRTIDEAEAIIRQAMLAGVTRDAQGNLFDDAFLAESLIKERGQVLSGALAKLKKDRDLFKTLTRDADAIEGAGNKLDEQANVNKVVENEQIIAQIQAKATTKSELSDVLQQLAARVKSGEIKLDAATRDLVESIRRSGDRFLPVGDDARPRGQRKKDDAQGDSGRQIEARANFERLQEAEGDQSLSDDLFRDTEKTPDINLDEIEIPVGERIDPDTGQRVTEVITATEVMQRAKRAEQSADAMEACIRA